MNAVRDMFLEDLAYLDATKGKRGKVILPIFLLRKIGEVPS